MEIMLANFINTVAKTIRLERVRQGFSQEQLADKADISTCYLNKIENARNVATVGTYIKIAAALQLQLPSLSCEDKSKCSGEGGAVEFSFGKCSDTENRVCTKIVKWVLAMIRDE
jgi:transcriptional regulator with XRE-family HTH domain